MPHSIKKNSYVLVLDLKNLIQLPSHTVRPLPAVEESQIHCPLNNDRLIHPDALEWHFIKRHGSKEKLKKNPLLRLVNDILILASITNVMPVTSSNVKITSIIIIIRRLDL
jgi:hypothetical protein